MHQHNLFHRYRCKIEYALHLLIMAFGQCAMLNISAASKFARNLRVESGETPKTECLNLAAKDLPTINEVVVVIVQMALYLVVWGNQYPIWTADLIGQQNQRPSHSVVGSCSSEMSSTKRPAGRVQKSFTGCARCKEKKKKCDESTPSCLACVRAGEECPGEMHRLACIDALC